MHQYDIDEAFNLIRELGRKCVYFEDQSGWGHKQDLYRIKELVDDTLQKIQEYPQEKEWLTYCEKQRIIKLLQSK